MKCSLEECEKQDCKGLYKLAREGKIQNFTGISAPYEEPAKPEILIETSKYSVDFSAKIVINYLKENGYIVK